MVEVAVGSFTLAVETVSICGDAMVTSSDVHRTVATSPSANASGAALATREMICAVEREREREGGREREREDRVKHG
tara:strand:- start:1164 stop:1394 length:231 start_codon:yes stop_codon:yes gene_type:complete